VSSATTTGLLTTVGPYLTAVLIVIVIAVAGFGVAFARETHERPWVHVLIVGLAVFVVYATTRAIP
jgi:uncharacterized protein (DUF983 family)